MSLAKRPLKTRPVSKVTFRLPAEAAPDTDQVYLVGEFNAWDPSATPMQRLRSGEFKVTLDLERGRRYEFRYLIGQENWENDWEADAYVPSGISGSDNSVVVV